MKVDVFIMDLKETFDPKRVYICWFFNLMTDFFCTSQILELFSRPYTVESVQFKLSATCNTSVNFHHMACVMCFISVFTSSELTTLSVLCTSSVCDCLLLHYDGLVSCEGRSAYMQGDTKSSSEHMQKYCNDCVGAYSCFSNELCDL
jgi:hypothetical protein